MAKTETHDPIMDPILAQIRAGWGEIKDLKLAVEGAEPSVPVLAYLAAVQQHAEKFREACHELAERVELGPEPAEGREPASAEAAA
jgi:hypothetical protein